LPLKQSLDTIDQAPALKVPGETQLWYVQLGASQKPTDKHSGMSKQRRKQTDMSEKAIKMFVELHAPSSYEKGSQVGVLS